MALLVQFLMRLTFGLALGMLITSPKLVTSGFFRNHLYVTLGLSALAALLCFSVVPSTLWYAVAAAGCSYLGAMYWLFEKRGPGKLMLLLVAIASLMGAVLQPSYQQRKSDVVTNSTERDSVETESTSSDVLNQAAVVSSGLLLGMTMAAMLLGHWYLNSPTMDLIPLRRLLLVMGIAVGLQTLLSAWGLWGEISQTQVTLQLSLIHISEPTRPY